MISQKSSQILKWNKSSPIMKVSPNWDKSKLWNKSNLWFGPNWELQIVERQFQNWWAAIPNWRAEEAGLIRWAVKRQKNLAIQSKSKRWWGSNSFRRRSSYRAMIPKNERSEGEWFHAAILLVSWKLVDAAESQQWLQHQEMQKRRKSGSKNKNDWGEISTK